MAHRERVRLTKKFAKLIDGVDISRAQAGDEIEVSAEEARILIAEGWAHRTWSEKAVAADTTSRKRHTRKQRARR